MRHAVLLGLMVTVCLPAFGAAEPIRLPGGETIEVTHPGVDGVSHPRALLSQSAPPGYPVSALGLDRDSRVTVAVLVRTDGSVAQAEVVHAEHPGAGFDVAAREAVRHWSFRPARQGRTKVNSYAFVTVNFKKPDDAQTLLANAAPAPPVPMGVSGYSGVVSGQLLSSAVATSWSNRPASHYGPLIQRVPVPRVGYGQLYYRPNLTPARPVAHLPSPTLPIPIQVAAPGAAGR